MSSEEYLDSLLRSLEESGNEEPSPLVKKIFKDIDDREVEELSSVSDVFEEVVPQAETFSFNDEEMIPSGNDILMGFDELQGLSGTEASEIPMDFDEPAIPDEFMDFGGKTSLEDLFAATDEAKVVSEAEIDSLILDDMDVTELIDSMSDLDDSLVEINDLLKKSDNKETLDVDAEMQAFLDSYHADEELSDLLGDTVNSETEAKPNEKNDVFSFFKNIKNRAGKKQIAEKQESGLGDDSEDSVKSEEEKTVSKKENFFKHFLNLFKNSKKEESVDDVQEDSVEAFLDSFALEKEEELLKKVPDNISEEEINSLFNGLGNSDGDSGFSEEFASLFEQNEDAGVDIFAEQEDTIVSSAPAKKEKKPGLIRRLIEALTAEDEEELLAGISENEEIMKELDSEDRAKKKKKGKNKKDKKEKAGSGDADIDDAVTEKKPEKQKKQRKAKKETDPLEVEMNKGKKVLSQRGLITLIAFCASLVAIIVAFAFFITDYADKQKARQAFYVGDYQEAYILLYDKTLGESDAMILERVRVILELQRHIEVHDFYDKTDQKALALNALLEGVDKYEELTVVNHFGSGRELEEIYNDILSLLNEKFGVSEAEAKEINSYNADQYTLTVYDIVNGNKHDTAEEGTGTEEAQPAEELQDVLPLEEELLNE